MNETEYKKRIGKTVITEGEIATAVEKAGKYIDALYDGNPLLLVGILNGSFVFLSDLCRAVSVPCEIAFMQAKSYYNGTNSAGDVKITLDLDRDISNYHVVIAEDIVDTGRTLSSLVDILKGRAPRSLHVITLLDKPSRRTIDFSPDLSLFTIPDLFVIGYGLDLGEYYRTLPYIAEYLQ